MHPDQKTPDSHRFSSPDSRERAPEQDQDDDAIDADPVSGEVEDGARVAEAGNAYVGRMLDDDLKSSPRVEDGDEAVDTDPSTARDD